MNNLDLALLGYSIAITLHAIVDYYALKKLMSALKDWRNYAAALTNEFLNKSSEDIQFIKEQQVLHGINQNDN